MVDRTPAELAGLIDRSEPPPLLERAIWSAQRRLLRRVPHLAWFWRLLVRLRLDLWPERLVVDVGGGEFTAWVDDAGPCERFGAIVLEGADRKAVRAGAEVVFARRRCRPQQRPV